MDKSPDAFRTISEVAQDLALPQHVLRFWETRFTQIKPLKRGGGRRYYRPDDVELLKAIRHMLYADGYTIKGVQRLLRERGARAVAAGAASGGLPPPDARDQAMEAAEACGGTPPDGDGEAPAPGASQAPPVFLSDAPADRVTIRPQGAPGATGVDRQALHAVLAELVECSRLLAAAREV